MDKTQKAKIAIKNRSSYFLLTNCNQGLLPSVTDVRKLYGGDRRPVQKPEAESESGNFNGHGEEEGHQPGYVGCGYPTCRTSCRLDNRNSCLRRAKKIIKNCSTSENKNSNEKKNPNVVGFITFHNFRLNADSSRSSPETARTP